jgi:hypothetical protein
MDAPELTNFGSLIRYSIELEAASAGFYAAAARLLGPGQPVDVARLLAGQHETRRGLLERTRQQKLNEMVLEPITGLDGRRYLFDASLHTPDEVPSKAIALEEVAALLYGETSVVAESVLTEAARTFRKLADQNLRNIGILRETFQR